MHPRIKSPPDRRAAVRLRPGKLFQKYTGLLASRRAAARLAGLSLLTCNHARHDDLACGDNASLAAAYPTALNDALVWALTVTPHPHRGPLYDEYPLPTRGLSSP